MLNFDHAHIDAPIGIIGQPNKIRWDAQNVLYAKISNGKENTLVTKNEFHFINNFPNKRINITFYGINEKSVKTFELHLLVVQKTPPPSPFLKKEYSLELNSEFSAKKIIPAFKTSFSIRSSTLELPKNIPIITDFKILIHPMDSSDLIAEMARIDRQPNIHILTNTIKNEKRLLPQPEPRPYHEVTMESRWFG